jgi:hypothetical protein
MMEHHGEYTIQLSENMSVCGIIVLRQYLTVGLISREVCESERPTGNHNSVIMCTQREGREGMFGEISMIGIWEHLWGASWTHAGSRI